MKKLFPECSDFLLVFSQGYAYPANGYVQTAGIQFDPNYSRTTTAYSSPTIQRYEFQAQQITPINQVSLQSVSFAPNVTYSQIASPAVLLNHQQHHSHYSAHQQHGDQNKPMTMSAALSATASGNEMPGYPRVNSVPPRSLSCNGYPGLNEYGGNSINTTAQTQAVTNTSSVQASQMHPPQSTSRPNSSNQMYQMQSPGHQSSNIHMSPTPQAQSPSSHQSQHYQQSSGMLPATSQQDSQQDWNQSSWNDNRQRANDVFNQSDRINLNTRLKTMILNKNDKDQQQQQQPTNHFLSYSHQHLSEQQQPLVNNQDLGKPGSNESKITAGDVGGSEIDDSWKSSIMKHEQENESTDYSKQSQQETNENDSVDSVGGKENENVGKSTERETDLNPIEPQFDINKNGADNVCDQEKNQSPNANQTMQKSEKPSANEREKQSYSYHSAHEYQQHKNMVNNIKKEPSEENAAGSIKYEGYEKNYQNFIRYADFCDAQQPQYDQKQTSYQQEYMQPQGYYNNYPYQNCAPTSQNYSQHSQTYQQFMTQQAAYQPHGHLQSNLHQSSSLTNFEQQIPLHTYPIPKHGPGSGGEMSFQPTNIKIEPNQSNNLHSYPMGENMIGAMKEDNDRFSRSNNNNMNVEAPATSKATKQEVSYDLKINININIHSKTLFPPRSDRKRLCKRKCQPR